MSDLLIISGCVLWLAITMLATVTTLSNAQLRNRNDARPYISDLHTRGTDR